MNACTNFGLFQKTSTDVYHEIQLLDINTHQFVVKVLGKFHLLLKTLELIPLW
jgi:hypothetical protein